MAFAPVFQRPFSGVFDRRATATVPWWLSGGISAANAIAAYQPKGAASLAASYVNLANPGTYDAVPGVAPTLGANGWTFNGLTQYLDSGVTPAGDNSWSMLVRFANGASDDSRFVAGTNTQRNFHLAPCVSGTHRQYAQPTKYRRVVNGKLTGGVMAVAGLSAYLNGSSDGTLATNVSDSTGNTIYIGAAHQTVGANSFFSGDVQAVAIYNTTLTAPQVAAVSAAMAAL